ncbi:uncharacterized protein LOC144554543 [Carex rostrata]
MDGGCIDFDLGGAKRIKVREGTCKSSPIEIPWIALNILSFLQGWKTAYSKKHKHQAFICNMLATHSKIFMSNMLATVAESEPLLHFQYLRSIHDMEFLKVGF